MASGTTVNITLDPELAKYVRSAVKRGGYLDAGEVIREALRRQREGALREVERKIAAGLASASRGEVYDGDAVFEEIRKLSRARRSASKKRK